MDTHTARGGFDTSPFTHRRQEPNTSNRIRPEPHRRPPSEKALQRPIEPPVRHTGHPHSPSRRALAARALGTDTNLEHRHAADTKLELRHAADTKLELRHEIQIP